MKIFVVEDEPVERKLIVTVLDAAGYEVERVRTTEEALAAIRDSQPTWSCWNEPGDETTEHPDR